MIKASGGNRVENITKLKVRFSETDLLGHVNNSSYFVYLEQGRVEFFNHLDPNSQGNRWHFILASVKCDFLKQAFFDQNLTIETKVKKIGNKSFQLIQNIFDSCSSEKIASSESAIIYFNFDTQKSEPIPPYLRTKLEQHLVNEEAGTLNE
jgi:acyl-CoA thioester hydrolase